MVMVMMGVVVVMMRCAGVGCVVCVVIHSYPHDIAIHMI